MAVSNSVMEENMLKEDFKQGKEYFDNVLTEACLLYTSYICGLSRIEYELYGRDYRRHADLAVDGTDHGIRLGIGNLRFRVDQAFVP